MDDKPASMTNRTALRRILDFGRAHWRMAALQLLLAVAGTSLILVFPSVVQWFVDDIIPNRRLDVLWQAAALAAGAFALREILFAFRTRLSSVFEQRMIFDLRGRLHHKVARMPAAWFDKQSTGDILTRMADDVPATQRVILEGIEQGVTAVMQIIISGVMMFYTNWQLALFVMLPTPWIAAGGWIFARWVSPRTKQAREASSRMNSLLHDTVTGIRQIKSYCAEDEKQRDFDKASGFLRVTQTRLMAAWAVYHPLMSFLGHIGLVLLLAAGAYGCIREWWSMGELLKFIFLIGFFFEPISRLHGVNQTLVSGLASATRVFEVLDLPGDEDLQTGRKLDHVEGRIAFENVSFGYGEREVLHDITLRVEPRQTVAIVGATGSGKSTIFQLLTRFYDPNQGRITLDGHSIADYSRASLRDAIGYVTQDTFLFAGTIRDNLRLGKSDATDDEMWAALRSACAEDFVKRLPESLDAEVGERGVLLSGGERQRLALARAFLKNAPVLLLDEATSAVDVKSERLIQQALANLRANRTSLVIAHRLSTITSADVIYVLHQGHFLAHGTHDTLLQSCAYYREMTAVATMPPESTAISDAG
ncbi:MAG: ABC transporter ATP-binding protein [Verrucomicrobiaceae bacterium]|nr:ABC transporter ATP-binding protein [Verrucomicrobiaceae bacterium]